MTIKDVPLVWLDEAIAEERKRLAESRFLTDSDREIYLQGFRGGVFRLAALISQMERGG